MTEAERELHETLTALCERLPVPVGSWHVHVAAIAAAHADFAAALDVCARYPAVLDLIGRALAGELDAGFDRVAASALTEAYDRFGALPIPAGRHPFLNEIMPTLEAIEASLLCLSLDRTAAANFA